MKEVSKKKVSKIQWAAIIAAAVGIVFGVISYFVPGIAVAGDIAYNYLIVMGIEGVAAFVGTMKDYSERTAEEIESINQKRMAKTVVDKPVETPKEPEQPQI